MSGTWVAIFFTLIVIAGSVIIALSILSEQPLTLAQCSEADGEFCLQVNCPDTSERIGEIREGTAIGLCCKGGCE